MTENAPKKQNDNRQQGRRLHLREVSTDISDYNGIGADFRAARVRNGESLEAVANGLRIRLEHLQAIEEGRFDALPAPVYAVGFVRSFAEHVGIDGADAIARFKAEAEGLSAQTRLSFPTPEEESRVPKGWLLLLAGVAAVMIYAGWYYVENKDRLNIAAVQPVPDRLADRTAQPTEKAVITPTVQEPAAPAVVASSADDTAPVQTETTENAETPPVTEPVAEISTPAVTAPAEQAADTPPATASQPTETPVTVTEPSVTRTEPTDSLVPTPAERALLASAATPQVQAASPPETETATAASAAEAPTPAVAETETAAIVPAAPVIPIAPSGSEASSPSVPSPGTERVNEPQVFGVGNWNARVVLTARADVWVQVSTADGRALLSRILRQGDKYLVPSQGEVLLTTGNAGALAITVDGKSVPPIGPAGAVRREVLLSPDRLLATAASGN